MVSKYILGISAFYHDSAAALLKNGEIIAAAQEERFTRKKHDERFPYHAIEYCLKEARLKLDQVDSIVFYEKPLIKFERLLETYLAYAPKGIASFLKSMPLWLKEKLFQKEVITKELIKLGGISRQQLPRLLFTEHHLSHASSAFYPSPFEKSAVLCLDGVGEWATTSAWLGEGRFLKPLWELDFPHSLGLLYSAFTYYTGFKVNSGEYKVMGLAPYGKPVYVKLIYDNLIDVKPDGTFRLNMDYFNFASGLTMTSEKFHKLFGGSPRQPESELSQRDMDLAASVQVVTEEIVLKLAKALRNETGSKNICLAGGVALNCVANGRLLREAGFDGVWIQPASGDAGGAVGAALAVWHQYYEMERTAKGYDLMKGSYLGPKETEEDIVNFFDSIGAKYERLDEDELLKKVSSLIAEGNVIGLHQGRMEYGPRALGNRSIIGDPRNTKMQSIMNLKIKYRESFRPFAPSVLRERVGDYFELNTDSPYMLLVASVKKEHIRQMTKEQEELFGIEKLNVVRSTIPAVTHIDYSARVQTVHPDTNPRYYSLIKEFEKLTGCPVLINTSFNVRGEPIVCTVQDSYRCFMRCEMDYLVVDNFLLDKKAQPKQEQDDSWKKEFVLD